MSEWPQAPKLGPTKIAAKLGKVSDAEALDFCQNVRRRQFLGLREIAVDDALRAELALWASRVTPEAIDAERSHEATPEADPPS